MCIKNIYPLEGIHKFSENKSGSDFIVGDIHGMYDLLMSSLNKMGFNFEKDRLFCVGDLVDRGKNSIKVLSLIDEPWFFSVMGNHDLQYLLQHKNAKKIDKISITYKIEDWFKELNKEEKKFVYKQIKKLPIGIQIETSKGKVAITHASIKNNYTWKKTKEDINKNKNTCLLLRHYIWSRNISKKALQKLQFNQLEEDKFIIPDIFCIYHGHSINYVSNFEFSNYHIGNRYFIDTGGVLGKYPEGLNLNFKKKDINKPALSFFNIKEPNNIYYKSS